MDSSMRAVRVPVLLAPVAAIVAIVVALVLLIVLPPIIAVVLGIAVGVGVAASFAVRAERAVVGSLRLQPVAPGAEARLQNMIDGLCDSHGFRRPTLALIDDPACNAVVFGRRPTHVTLAVTTGLRDALTRMELEGLLARELALATHEGLPGATVLVPLLGVLPSGLRDRARSWYLGEDRSMLDDFDAVRFTRYPPGLAAALDKMGEASTFVAGAGRTSAHLWVVAPDQQTRLQGGSAVSPAPSSQPTIHARAAALREL
jgi:heat shock protein HtpX